MMMKQYSRQIFGHTTLRTTPVQGGLLVAEPFLREDYFRHAVISLIDCDGENGSMGVVLNNPIDLKLDEVLEGVSPDTEIPLYCGGPMSQDRLFFIHTLGPEIVPGSRAYAPGLWVGGDFDTIISYVNRHYPTRGIVRFFIGYSGWEAGQLDGEIDRDVWAAASPGTISPETILSADGDRLWHTAVRALGCYYRNWALHPLSPQFN